MKFSVLLPTRNRLELLKQAVNSVLTQDYGNWEVIVYDNFSSEDIEGYVRALNDSRIHYYRTSEFVSVTENWNNAIEKSSGDYIVMLGDDDCLMRGYFTRMIRLLKDFPCPDFVYTSSFIYAYPGVMPGYPDGFLYAFGNAIFIHQKNAPFWLDKQEAMRCVQSTMDFKLQFSFNMQYSLIRREFYDRCKRNGQFFHSPYPDYYATTMMMLKAERILVFPFPAVAIGISNQSYGYYYFNRKEARGAKLLNNSLFDHQYPSLKDVVLPGSDMNTSWLMAMESIRSNFEEASALKVNYERYKCIQVEKIYKDWLHRAEGSRENLKALKKHLKGKDKFFIGICDQVYFFMVRLCKKWLPPTLWSKIRGRVLPPSEYPWQRVEGKFITLQDVYEKIDPQQVKQS